MVKSRAPAAGASGPGHAVVALRGAGRIQRRIWRAFMTFPDAEMTTSDLVPWCIRVGMVSQVDIIVARSCELR